MASPKAFCQPRAFARPSRAAETTPLFVVARGLLPVQSQRGTVLISYRDNEPCVNGAPMTDDNRTRPPVSGVRAGYGSPSGPRYQPRPLVTSGGGDAARSARPTPRGGGSGKKEIFCAIG